MAITTFITGMARKHGAYPVTLLPDKDYRVVAGFPPQRLPRKTQRAARGGRRQLEGFLDETCSQLSQ